VPLVWPMQIFFLTLGIFGVSAVTQLTLFFVLTLSETVHLIWLLGNVMLLLFVFLFFVLSILALYLSRVFIETQNRPFYVIDQVYPAKG
jgi:hypothetical protein